MEQIIITQGDSGIAISPAFVNSSKAPVNITGCTIEINLIYPDSTMGQEYGQIVDAANGRASFILTSEHTAQSGLVATYWKVIDENSEITAQEEIYYYVREYLGGAV